MKNLILTTAIIALTSTSAFAQPPVPPKEPPVTTTTTSTSNDAGLAILVAILGIILYNTLQDEPENAPCVTDQSYDGEKADPYIVPEC